MYGNVGYSGTEGVGATGGGGAAAALALLRRLLAEQQARAPVTPDRPGADPAAEMAMARMFGLLPRQPAQMPARPYTPTPPTPGPRMGIGLGGY